MTLRFTSKNGRSQLVVGNNDRLVDLAEASGGRFSSEPIDAFRRWDEVSMFLVVIVTFIIVVDTLSSSVRRRLV